MLHNHTARAASVPYMDGPNGLMTRNGIRFSMREKQLEDACSPLEKYVSSREVVERAESAVISSRILPAYVLLIISAFISPWLAIPGALVFSIFWHAQKSAFAGAMLKKVNDALGNDIFFVIAGVLALSRLGNSGEYVALVCSMVLFMAFKFGWIVDVLEKFVWKEEKAIFLNDRSLLMVLRKLYVKHDIKTAEIAEMEARLTESIVSVRKKWMGK